MRLSGSFKQKQADKYLYKMADFCQYCSKVLFGEDCGDLKGLTTPEDTQNGVKAAAICEGCGFVTVDHLGRCTCHTEEEHNKILSFEEPPSLPDYVRLKDAPDR